MRSFLDVALTRRCRRSFLALPPHYKVVARKLFNSMKLFLLLITFTVSLFAQADLPREALLIGVGDYAGTFYKGAAIPSLPGITTADLPKMKAKLESLGFRVTALANPTRRQADAAIAAFAARIKANPGVSLFYFRLARV